MWNVVLIVSIVVMCVAIYLQTVPRTKVPKHLLGYKAFAMEHLISDDLVAELVDLMKEMKHFQSNVDQSKAQGFKPVHEDFGESQPIEADGTCKHSLLFPNADHTRCIFPQRIDVGKHYLLTGGLEGSKENFHDLIDRVSSFGRYTFPSDIEKYPSVKRLFTSEAFQTAAKSICPNFDNNTVLDTFQFNYIMQVPGQTVSLHMDSPYFWGASRYQFPQWMLVAMVFSGLFQKQFIDQIQVVGYLHEWEIKQNTGGEFVYFLSDSPNDYGVVAPTKGSGTFVDGSKVIHAAKVYRPDVKAPHMDKDQDCALTFFQGDAWGVVCDGKTIANYNTSDLRMAIVYRARCFKDQEKLELYQEKKDEIMDFDEIVNKFKTDLVEKKGFKADYINSLARIDLAQVIMDTYSVYPLPPIDLAFIPWNYCALPLLYPWTEKFLSFFCK
jgi:hypothetical protein